MHPLRYLLFPLSLPYKWATNIRNYLYDIGHKKSFRFEVPVISVGNLNLGGSGKTPMIEYLIRILKGKYKLATLSRGYGRNTRGVRFVSTHDNAGTVGDEPHLLFKKFGNEIKVVVGEDRALAIPTILDEQPDVNIILLDDAFQHRTVNPHLNILLTRYSRPFYEDHVLPLGYLREARKNAARADVILVTKCPEVISENEKKGITTRINEYSGEKPVFFSGIGYELPLPFSDVNISELKRVVLLTGIANPKPFLEFARRQYQVLRHFQFPDHHRFENHELVEVRDYIRKQGQDVALLTTEKDSVRLGKDLRGSLKGIPCFCVPITTFFLENGSEFDAIVARAIEKTISIHQTA
jgi:tetraacyldisaccharide 4'-kinase